jgi:hypothetical protein
MKASRASARGKVSKPRGLLLAGGLGMGGTLAALVITFGTGQVQGATESPYASPSASIDGSILLNPVPDGYVPRISRDKALEIAKGVEPVSNDVSIQLASITIPGVGPVDSDGKPTGPDLYQEVPAWVVTIEGVCIPFLGEGTPPKDGCVGHEADVIIDAEAGSVIEDYSYR